MIALYITGYPRSGNTWTNRLLSDILDSPLKNFPEMEPIYYGEQGGDFTIAKRHSTVKEGPTLFVYRDPRDVAVSRMFYRRMPSLRFAIRGMVETSNGDQYDITGAPIAPYETFVRTWYNTGLAEAQVAYEDLHARPVEVLTQALLKLTGREVPAQKIQAAVERQSFAAYVARNGPEHAMRKGVAGDWRNHFCRETGKLITNFFGALMLEQGYIQSLDWWKELP